MFTPVYFALLNHLNATTATAEGHNSGECSTATIPAPAEQLDGAKESPPVQRLIEIRTPIYLKAIRR